MSKYNNKKKTQSSEVPSKNIQNNQYDQSRVKETGKKVWLPANVTYTPELNAYSSTSTGDYISDHFWNADCITGAPMFVTDCSVDLIITDPPFGIKGDTLDKHYNRDESNVIEGYVEVPLQQYPQFTVNWIMQAERVLKPGGSMYVITGWTHLVDVLNALDNTSLNVINHIVWHYNFGVYTKNKYVSSHYHVIYCVKPGGKPVFNTLCRYGHDEKDMKGGSLNYQDRQDVWIINREYNRGEIKNKNQLPTELVKKMIMYSSNQGDMVCDFFLGSFQTAKVAIAMGRRVCGFEINPRAYTYQIKEMEKIITLPEPKEEQ